MILRAATMNARFMINLFRKVYWQSIPEFSNFELRWTSSTDIHRQRKWKHWKCKGKNDTNYIFHYEEIAEFLECKEISKQSKWKFRMYMYVTLCSLTNFACWSATAKLPDRRIKSSAGKQHLSMRITLRRISCFPQ